MKRKTLFLFDIDGTIISRKKRGSSPFRRMLKEFFGIENPVFDFRYAGKTDIWIIERMMEKHFPGKKLTSSELKKALDMYVEFFYKDAKIEDYIIHSGVIELIRSLKEDYGAILGVVTGNIERTGWRKLEIVGIRDLFSFGAFGDKGSSREDMVREALEKGKRLFGDFDEVFVVGDTPHDILSAKHHSLKSIAVATGPHYSYEDLKKYSPDFIYKDFSDYKRVLLDIFDHGGSQRG